MQKDKEKKSVKEWISDHKKAITITCITVAGVVVVYVFREDIADGIKAILDKAREKIDPSEIKDSTLLFSEEVISELKDYMLTDDEVEPNIIPFENIKNSRVYSGPFPVKGHLMKLPDGKKISQQKLKELAELGMDAPPEGYTFVRDYLKCKNKVA